MSLQYRIFKEGDLHIVQFVPFIEAIYNIQLDEFNNINSELQIAFKYAHTGKINTREVSKHLVLEINRGMRDYETRSQQGNKLLSLGFNLLNYNQKKGYNLLMLFLERVGENV